jgi:hypothetical protein
MYMLHVKCHWIALHMIYGVIKELPHKILVHNPCSLKLMDSLQSVIVRHSICEDCYTSNLCDLS